MVHLSLSHRELNIHIYSQSFRLMYALTLNISVKNQKVHDVIDGQI